MAALLFLFQASQSKGVARALQSKTGLNKIFGFKTWKTYKETEGQPYFQQSTAKLASAELEPTWALQLYVKL